MVDINITPTAIGDLNYIQTLNQNFANLKAGIELVDQLRQDAQSGSPVNALDAVQNVENACCNGRFFMNFCTGDDSILSQMPRLNDNYGTRRVVDVDGWFVKPDFMESSSDQSSIIATKDAATGDIVVTPGNVYDYTGTLTGVIFQRLDYFWPIEQIRGRAFSFWVRYTAQTDDEIYLEIDDGVGVTNTLAAPGGPSPSSQNTVFVSRDIDAAATKLCVKIVTLKDAVSGSNALRIHECYGRFGGGTVSLPYAVSPQVMARDLVCSQMMARAFVFGAGDRGVRWPASIGFDGRQEYTRDIFMDVPLIYADPNDVIMETDYRADSGNDERSLINASLTFELTGSLGWSTKTLSRSALIEVTRPVGPTDGSQGFVADQLDAKVCIIPDC